MAQPHDVEVEEQKRLNDAREEGIPWKRWGPYLSERQWGTVREDYSADGNAWEYFSHDQARSRAYRSGEDGLGGICDDKQRLCFALALWNERDPILKERMFGLTNGEGNHGEDVKEYYFYIDSTPTHSYMKYLYKYPKREYPYRLLVETNRKRSRTELEYELLDTGVFDDDRYFDVFVEYAKAGPEDVLIRIAIHNRAPSAARLRVLPTLWFRNTWSWGDDGRPSLRGRPGIVEPRRTSSAPIGSIAGIRSCSSRRTRQRARLGSAQLISLCQGRVPQYVVAGHRDVNPAKTGTKAATATWSTYRGRRAHSSSPVRGHPASDRSRISTSCSKADAGRRTISTGDRVSVAQR
jgi:hypothetical protein